MGYLQREVYSISTIMLGVTVLLEKSKKGRVFFFFWGVNMFQRLLNGLINIHWRKHTADHVRTEENHNSHYRWKLDINCTACYWDLRNFISIKRGFKFYFVFKFAFRFWFFAFFLFQRNSISPAEREKYRARSPPEPEHNKKVKKEEKDCHVSFIYSTVSLFIQWYYFLAKRVSMTVTVYDRLCVRDFWNDAKRVNFWCKEKKKQKIKTSPFDLF